MGLCRSRGKFVEEEGIGELFRTLTPAIPTHFLIDRKGRIRHIIEGYEPGELEKSIEEVLG